MKASVKRFLSALMVLAMLLSMLSVVSFAAGTTTTVYCQAPDGWTACKIHWWGSADTPDTAWPGNDMAQDENGIWYIEVPADAAGLVINNGSGSQTTDLTVPTDDKNMYVYATATWDVYGRQEIELSYYVAGDFNVWLNPDPNCKMVKQADGTYALTLTLEPGNHELKVTDGTWDNSWGEAGSTANYCFTAAEAGEFVVTFDGVDTVEVTGALADPNEMVISYIAVAGAEELVGAAWEPAYEVAVMEQNDQVYTLTLENVPAGEHEFKFVANGTWDLNWASGDVMVPGETYTAWFRPMGNSVIIVENEGATVTLTLDLTNMDYVTGEGAACSVAIEGGTPVDPVDPPVADATYYVAGDFNGWLNPDEATVMTKLEDGTYALTLTLEAGNHELKVTDGTWVNSWGEVGGTGNYVFYLAEAKEVTVTFDGVGTVNVIGADEIPPETLPEILYMAVAGSAGLTGIEWEPTQNLMTANGSVYTITFTGIAAGTYDYKFVANGNWELNWASGIEAESGEEQDAWFLPVGNSSLTVAEDNATVTLTLDLTNMDPITGEGGKTMALVEVPETTDPQVAIVDAAYALAEGESMTEAVTLTGVITSIDTPYSTMYKNITVTIAVAGREDKPILCYRLMGDGADTLAVGDTITVTGTLKNYKGTIEFDQGCTLDAVEKGEGEVIVAPEDPLEIVDAAYALEAGATLPYEATLTGTVTEIVTAYDETYGNISVNMVVEGREDKPILCHRLKGEGADTLAVGDIITVTGNLMNYNGTVELTAGTLDAVVKGEVIVVPEDPCEIVDAAYALEAGAALPYEATLTGTVTEIVTAYSEIYQNISVNMVVEGREDKPILCYRLKGDGADTLTVGDIITVTGNLKNYTKTDSVTGITSSTIEFAAGCTLDAVVAVPQISGSVTWYHGDAPTVELWANGTVVYTAIVTDGTYTIRNVEAGTYTLMVSLDDHVAREYTVTVGTEDVVLNVGIHLIGDANLDGEVNVGDAARAYAHAKSYCHITDECALAAADVTGDGRVNVADVARIYAHAKETSLLFD